MKTRINTVITGLLLIVLAVSLILWKLNVFNLPVALAGVGVFGLIVAFIMAVCVVQNIIDLNFGGIFIPLAIIAIIFDDALGITAITPWVVLIAAVLLTIAFGMLFPKHHRFSNHLKGNNGFGGKYTQYTETSDESNGGYVMHSMRFGSATKYVRSQDLVKADLTSSFGELSVFFDGAHAAGDKVVIDCRASFGQMNIFVPQGWEVINKTNAIFGSSVDNTNNHNVPENAVKCVIQGSVSFGELVINRV